MTTWKKNATPIKKTAFSAVKGATTSGMAKKKILKKASQAPAVQKARPIATGGIGTTRSVAKPAVSSGMAKKKAAPKAAAKISKPSANKKLY